MNSEARIQPIKTGRKPQYAESRIFYQSDAFELIKNGISADAHAPARRQAPPAAFCTVAPPP